MHRCSSIFATTTTQENFPLGGAYFSTTAQDTVSEDEDDTNEINTPISSPSRTSTTRSNEEPRHKNVDRLSTQRSTSSDVPVFQHRFDPSLLSTISQHFTDYVSTLNKSRQLYCASEYPLSFTGEEALKILGSILPPEVTHAEVKRLARVLLHTTPALIRPTPYAEKSIRKNNFYEKPSEIYYIEPQTELPQGVYVPFTSCYSPRCDPNVGCYANSCPNRPPINRTHSTRSDSGSAAASSIASSHDTAFSKSWQGSVSREILQSTPPDEIKRQEAIYELIYTEEGYLGDLNLLGEVYARPLRTAQCLPANYRDSFCDKVFGNYADLIAIHKALYRELHDHQLLCQERTIGGFVDRVGDILLRHVSKFVDVYSKYGPQVPLAEYEVKRELRRNILFHNFVKERQRLAECRKLPYRHFMVSPVTRLQRYPLLLDAIIKKTPEDHSDKADLTACLNIIRQACDQVNSLSAEKRMELRVYEISDNIEFKVGEPTVDLKLDNPSSRKLLHEGTLKRRKQMAIKEYQVFLFDHMLVFTKLKGEKHVAWGRPIPIELLRVGDESEISLGSRTLTSTAATFMTASSGPFTPPHTITAGLPSPPVGAVSKDTQSCSLLFQHMGRNGDIYAFQVSSPAEYNEWKSKISRARKSFEELHPERRVFELHALSDTTFSSSAGLGKVVGTGKFVGARKLPMVVIATEVGIWMGTDGEPMSIRKVMSVNGVTQISVMEDIHMLLVLADKTLTAYPIDELDPTSHRRSPQRPSFNIASSVSFFRSGVIDNQSFVVATMRKKSLDTVFKSFIPVCGDLRDPKNSKFLTKKSGFLSKAPPAWFQPYKEFYVGAQATDINVLSKNIAVVCDRGFEIMNLEKLSMHHDLPNLEDPDFDFIVESKNESTPLAIFRCGREGFLLCYTTTAFLVSAKGRYMRTTYPRIEWIGNPQSVAFHYPYVIAFDSTFIEVWNVENGEFVQLIEGMKVRRLHCSSHVSEPIIHGCMTHPFKPDFQYVFHLKRVEHNNGK
ncbi:hypothetical protein BX666DRAFT_1850207 [Dichotomocladium elegans]|nr:hypothetical protein BX666DRAFT_1850207 [Dichotomocladium elegans]